MKTPWYQRGFIIPDQRESFLRAREYVRPIITWEDAAKNNLARVLFKKGVKYAL